MDRYRGQGCISHPRPIMGRRGDRRDSSGRVERKASMGKIREKCVRVETQVDLITDVVAQIDGERKKKKKR